MNKKYETLVEELLIDPVRAAECLLGTKGMTPQERAQLTALWWLDREERLTISGKDTCTHEVAWIFSVLRCVLIPDHICVVYWNNAKLLALEYLPFFEVYSTDFNNLIVKENLSAAKGGISTRTFEFRNESKLIVMKPNFSHRLAESMVTTRFNTVLTSDIPDDQLDLVIGKMTRQSFGYNHPLFRNKRLSL